METIFILFIQVFLVCFGLVFIKCARSFAESSTDAWRPLLGPESILLKSVGPATRWVASLVGLVFVASPILWLFVAYWHEKK